MIFVELHSPIAFDASESVALDALLVDALDRTDERRIALITALCMIEVDADRAADLDRLRRDGLPPVRPF